MSKKKTHDEFLKQLYAINPTITILGQYKNNKTTIRCRCNVCGHEWLGTPSHLLRGHGCRKCADRALSEKKLWTHESFLEELSKVTDTVIIKSQYRGANEKVDCECAICGYTWSAKPAQLLSGHGCKKCGYKKAVETRANNGNPNDIRRRLTQSEFKRRLYSINPNVKMLGDYQALKKKIQVECLICGHVWSPSANNLLEGYGCPNCNHGSTSYPEQFIYKTLVSALGQDNVLSRDCSAIGKELDIYIPSIGIAIEYGSWHWHKDRLEDDKGKIALCKEKGIRLITVLDNCPKGFMDNDFWCYHRKLKKDDNDLYGLTIHILKECGVTADYDYLDFHHIDGEARDSSRKKTTYEFKQQLAHINPNVEVLGEYANSKSKIKVSCVTCGHTWYATPNNLLNGYGCPQCKNENSRERHSKPVLCVETGFMYKSIQSASKSMSCNYRGISACCRGKQKTAGGYHWRYVEK